MQQLSGSSSTFEVLDSLKSLNCSRVVKGKIYCSLKALNVIFFPSYQLFCWTSADFLSRIVYINTHIRFFSMCMKSLVLRHKVSVRGFIY